MVSKTVESPSAANEVVEDRRVIRIIECKDPYELIVKDRNDDLYPICIYLDMDSGKMWADVSPEDGTPYAIHFGTLIEYRVNTLIDGKAANKLLHEIAPLAQIILDNSDREFDANANYVGIYNDVAEAADDKITDHISHVESSFEGYISASEWYCDMFTSELDDLVMRLVTMSDEELKEEADLQYKDALLNGFVLWGVESALRDLKYEYENDDYVRG